MASAFATALALIGFAEANYYARYYNTRCYAGHGGTPLDAHDTPIRNITSDKCQGICDNTTKCTAFTLHLDAHTATIPVHLDAHNGYNPYVDCYLRSQVNLHECEVNNSGSWHSNISWATFQQVDPPAKHGNIVYHLFEAKYTGLADRDAGDFKGDTGFIFGTFQRWEKGNPEASMEHNIIEMSEVNVTGWGEYEECNAPGAEGLFNCPANQTEYCCTVFGPGHHNIPANHTRTQFPGHRVNPMSLGSQYGFGGWWLSFPKESENVTWTERLRRRIAGKCLGDAWRKDAGGCDHCGDELDSCVADCIKAALCVNGSVTLLEATWDRVFAAPTECPDVPIHNEPMIIV